MFKYIKLTDMLKEVVNKKKQLKQVLYRQEKGNQTQKQFKTAAAYSLLSLVLNNMQKFSQFTRTVQKKIKAQIKNKFLFIVMTAEYLNVGKIQGGGKIKKLILDHLEYLPQINLNSKINKERVQIRLISSLGSNNHSEAQREFSKIKQLFENKMHFKKDQIVPNLYHLNSAEYKDLLKQHPHILDTGLALVQSFSSCLPPLLLLEGVQSASLSSFQVIDTCSAPGNKTLQLSQYIKNKEYTRKVLAFQKDPRRFKVLNNTLQKYAATNVKGFNQNFLQTDPNETRFKKVKFIMLDPSCSGSGMLSNYLRDLNSSQTENFNGMEFEEFCDLQYQNLPEKEKSRVIKLHDFQIQLLKHAAKFKPKRLSYSTCSIYKKQNQEVVQQFLSSNPEYALKKSKLINYSEKDKNFSPGFGEFKECVRLDPRQRNTDGFFVSVFYLKNKPA